MPLPEHVREAMQAIIDYNWKDEEYDFERAPEEGNSQEGHIFLSLQVVNSYLADEAER